MLTNFFIFLKKKKIAEILNQEQSLVFPSFTADTAWALGNALRARLAALPGPVVVSIASTNGSHLLFHTVTRGGTAPDNDAWVRRKRAAVERWGCSTWLLQNKFGGDEDAWRSKFGSKLEKSPLAKPSSPPPAPPHSLVKSHPEAAFTPQGPGLSKASSTTCDEDERKDSRLCSLRR